MKKTCPMKASDGGGRDDGKGKGYPKVRSAQQGRGGDGKRDDGTLPGSEPSTSTAAASSSSSASTTMDSSATTTSVPTSTSSAQEMDEFLRNATQVPKNDVRQAGRLRRWSGSLNEDVEGGDAGVPGEEWPCWIREPLILYGWRREQSGKRHLKWTWLWQEMESSG